MIDSYELLVAGFLSLLYIAVCLQYGTGQIAYTFRTQGHHIM